jgi:hypothetical protein
VDKPCATENANAPVPGQTGPTKSFNILNLKHSRVVEFLVRFVGVVLPEIESPFIKKYVERTKSKQRDVVCLMPASSDVKALTWRAAVVLEDANVAPNPESN